MAKYMLDTNIFNKVLNGSLILDHEPEDEYFATDIQYSELSKTKNLQKRNNLQETFKSLVRNEIPTESFIMDFSIMDSGAKLGDGKIYSEIKTSLDEKNEKENNLQDALIGEAAIKNDLTLFTADRDLAKIIKGMNGKVVTCDYKENYNGPISKLFTIKTESR